MVEYDQCILLQEFISIEIRRWISIKLNSCEPWILTEELINKQEIFPITCYRIILVIKQPRDHVKNESLYHLTDHTQLREHQLKATGHWIRMPTDEFANRFVISLTKRVKDDISQSNFHILSGEKTQNLRHTVIVK